MVDRSPDVSVIIPVYNCMPYLERTLQSLRDQTIGLDRMQVLVADDGSDDGSFEVVERLPAEHSAFEVLARTRFGGPAGPRNVALNHVKGRFVFFLDADDFLAPDTLGAAVAMADDNGTDVVLARIKGVGGRSAPSEMYTRTIPRTDVFHSAAYWTLNPMKLFRTELIRANDLRFGEDLPWGEDQPFVAGAMLAAEGISILADQDYVFWVYREGFENITTSATRLADRMPVVDFMFDFVAARVPPGADRDRLMYRHFAVEMRSSAFEGYRTETDPAVRADAFERFREVTRAYYTPYVEEHLRPEGRVLMRLVTEGREAEFGEYLDALADAGPEQVVAEDGGVFLALPWFRDATRGLPDALFEIGSRLRAECRMQPLVQEAGGLRISATARLGALTPRVDRVEFVARSRDGRPDAVIQLAHVVTLEGSRPVVGIEDVVSPQHFVAQLREGTYDIMLRVGAQDIVRECRVAECAPPPAAARIVTVGTAWGSATAAALKTTSKGNLALRVNTGTGVIVGARLARERSAEVRRGLVERITRKGLRKLLFMEHRPER